MNELCFWSVADGEYSFMLQTLLHSYRGVGMDADFHVLCDRNIVGATTHTIKSFDKRLFHFKFDFLKTVIKNLNYRYVAFLDADTYFVRKPRPFLDLMDDTPLHIFLESDCTLPSTRKEWHCCPLLDYVRLMRECGITQDKVYNVNAGFFIVKRDAIDTVCMLAQDFWEYSLRNGYVFTEEAPLAYATQMLCGDPERHVLRLNTDLWCSDWTGYYAGRLPDGQEWTFADYMSYEAYPVNPAIVHAIKSKEAMIKFGRSL